MSVVISVAMSCGGHLGRVAEGRDWVTSNSSASRASKNLLIWSAVQRRSQLTARYSPMAQTCGDGTSAPTRRAGPGGGRAAQAYHRREHVPATAHAAAAAHELQELLRQLHHQGGMPLAQDQELGAHHPAQRGCWWDADRP